MVLTPPPLPHRNDSENPRMRRASWMSLRQRGDIHPHSSAAKDEPWRAWGEGGSSLDKDGDSLRVDGAKIGVFEKVDEVRLGRLLERG